jgi:hypothetical protein
MAAGYGSASVAGSGFGGAGRQASAEPQSVFPTRASASQRQNLATGTGGERSTGGRMFPQRKTTLPGAVRSSTATAAVAAGNGAAMTRSG